MKICQGERRTRKRRRRRKRERRRRRRRGGGGGGGGGGRREEDFSRIGTCTVEVHAFLMNGGYTHIPTHYIIQQLLHMKTT
jgi:Predicted metalloprotease